MKQGLEWQVTSLEWSQKLKKLGVKQESLFYWTKWRWQNEGQPKTTTTGGWKIVGEGLQPHFPNDSELSAFTVMEILELLNQEVTIPLNVNVPDFLANLLIDKLSALV